MRRPNGTACRSIDRAAPPGTADGTRTGPASARATPSIRPPVATLASRSGMSRPPASNTPSVRSEPTAEAAMRKSESQCICSRAVSTTSEGDVRDAITLARPARAMAPTTATSRSTAAASTSIVATERAASVVVSRESVATTTASRARSRLISRIASVVSPKSATAPNGKLKASTYAYRPSSWAPSDRTSATETARFRTFVTSCEATSAPAFRTIEPRPVIASPGARRDPARTPRRSTSSFPARAG